MAREFFKGEAMKDPKCPECGEVLHHRAKKCKSCSALVVICSECGSAYAKDEEKCDMCGRELVKRKTKNGSVRETQAEPLPDDLVSIINRIKSQGVGAKIFIGLRWFGALILAVMLILSVAAGLIVGDLGADMAVMAISGESNDSMTEHFNTTPSRNIEILKTFIKDISKSDATFSQIIKFSNFLVTVSFLPIVVIYLFYILFCIPLDIFEKLYIGIAVKKIGYNRSDTLAIFERPSLLYNSKDSFNKAYTYFPFIEKTNGRARAVISDLVFYGANILCGTLWIGVQIVHIGIKIGTHLLITGNALNIIITISAVLSVVIYIAGVALVIVTVKLVTKAMHDAQLENFAIKK